MSSFDEENRSVSRKQEIDALFAELGIGSTPSADEKSEPETIADYGTPVSPIVTELYDDEPETIADYGTPVSPVVTELYDADEPPVAEPGKKEKKHRIRRFFLGLIPRKGDSPLEVVRKCICVLALLVLLGSLCVLLDDLVITPIRNSVLSNANNQRLTEPLTEEEANYGGYPAGILEKFKKSYYHNHDLIGWINYPSSSEYWHGVDYAVVQRPGDNDFYLKHDFDQKENKNGSIFMDYRCDYATRDSHCPVTLIYGHNMRSGQMFASLNQLLDSLSMARCSPTFTFSSLFEENQYKVFAVLSVDTNEEGAYDFLNKTINSDEEMEQYIAEMRVRSWYNYTGVDVDCNDDIVLLYTCSNTYQTTMGKSGRTIVAARRVRDGESPEVDTSTIVDNPNTVMPKVWYANKGLSLPDYYKNGLPSTTKTGTTAVTAKKPTTTTAAKKTTTKTTAPTAHEDVNDEPAYEEPYEDEEDTPTEAPTKQTTAAPTETPTEPTEAPTETPTEPTTEPTEADPEPTTEPTEPVEAVSE